ncbi:PAS domain-containing protein [Haloferula luteola]|uniref:PAS domain-containing protein n=1 Tax=Haloferula luteola TaxID=595692 RepID=A0A840UZ60_9BACT|nr:hypothetical protein [Haloferula luteola]MBB5351062.1 PAS domain-containing protein [Haloferula luteola]
MIWQTMKWGDPLEIALQLKDPDGEIIPMDETWRAVIGFSLTGDTSDPDFEFPMVIEDGMAMTDLDTREEPFEPGVLYYDIRYTDPEGKDRWTETTRLTLEHRQASASA